MCVDIKIMEDRCIMKQRTLVTLLIIETVILVFVLLGKGYKFKSFYQAKNSLRLAISCLIKH